jgi:hypothetical protein
MYLSYWMDLCFEYTDELFYPWVWAWENHLGR